MDLAKMTTALFVKNGLLTAFMVIGIVTWLSYYISNLTNKRIHGSAIAIVFGLVLAYWGGLMTGGNKGIADVKVLSGIGLMAAECCVISPSYPPPLVRGYKKLKRRESPEYFPCLLALSLPTSSESLLRICLVILTLSVWRLLEPER